jgi:8-oxo-dGTP diphosphatase
MSVPVGFRPQKLVVAGLLCQGDRVLLARRRADQAHPGQWEFPGGKIEPGEAPTDALRRELREELAVDVEVGGIWDVLFHRYPDFDLLMLVYFCALVRGATPVPREVAEVVWSPVAELMDYDVLPADAPLIARLAREGVPQTIVSAG